MQAVTEVRDQASMLSRKCPLCRIVIPPVGLQLKTLAMMEIYPKILQLTMMEIYPKTLHKRVTCYQVGKQSLGTERETNKQGFRLSKTRQETKYATTSCLHLKLRSCDGDPPLWTILLCQKQGTVETVSSNGLHTAVVKKK